MYIVVIYFNEKDPHLFTPKNISHFKVNERTYVFLVVDYLKFVAKIRKKYKNYIKFVNVLKV